MIEMLRKYSDLVEYNRVGARAGVQRCEDACSAAAAAAWYCTSCTMHICSMCHPNSHKQHYQRDHVIVPIGEKGAQGGAAGASPMCAEHRMPITLYCEECKVRDREHAHTLRQ
jgi:hypothetical protein